MYTCTYLCLSNFKDLTNSTMYMYVSTTGHYVRVHVCNSLSVLCVHVGIAHHLTLAGDLLPGCVM